MTAQEKAKQLYNTFYSTNVHPNSVQVRHEIAKEFAIKCINELIIYDDECGGMSGYLIEVREEIEKL